MLKPISEHELAAVKGGHGELMDDLCKYPLVAGGVAGYLAANGWGAAVGAVALAAYCDDRKRTR